MDTRSEPANRHDQPLYKKQSDDLEQSAENNSVKKLEKMGFEVLNSVDGLKPERDAHNFLEALEILTSKEKMVVPCDITLVNTYSELRFGKDNDQGSLYLVSGASPERVASFMEFAPAIYAETLKPVSEADVIKYKEGLSKVPSPEPVSATPAEFSEAPHELTPEEIKKVPLLDENNLEAKIINDAANKLGVLCEELGIELDFDEKGARNFKEKDIHKFVESVDNIRESLELVADKPIKEKFSNIFLHYPNNEPKSLIYVEDNKLYIDLSIDRRDLKGFLVTLFKAEEKKEDEKEERKEEELVAPKSEMIDGIKIDTTLYDERQSSEDYNVKSEIDGALQDLDESEKEILRKEAGFVIAIKSANVMAPVYDENSKMLSVGVHNTGEEIVDAIRKTVIPLIQGTWTPEQKVAESTEPVLEPEITPPSTTPQPIPESITPPTPLTLRGEPEIQAVDPINFENPQHKKWLESEQNKELERLRDDLAKMEAFGGKQSDENFRELEAKYLAKHGEVADMIKSEIRQNVGEGPLTPEQEKKLEIEAGGAAFEFLTKKEVVGYRKTLEENKPKNILGEGMEMAKKALSTKGFRWYASLDWRIRLVATSAIITAGAYVFGSMAATGALVFGAKRLTRGALSFGAVTGARGVSEKIWSEEKINKEKEIKLEELKTKHLSRTENFREIRTIEEEALKKIKQAKLRKLGVSVLAGAGAAAFVGLAEDVPKVFTPPTPSVPEPQPFQFEEPPKINITQDVKDIPPLPGQPEISISEPPIMKTETISTPKPAEAPMPEPTPIKASVQPETIKTGGVAEGIFDNTDAVKHDVTNGYSTWGALNKTLDHSDRFKNLSGTAEEITAKKTFVISSYTNEALKNPEQYGIGPNGELVVGQKLDFSKLFENKAKFDEILEKAEKLSPQKIQNIIDNNGKISTWVNDPTNKGVPLNNDKVSEILNTEAPKTPKPSTLGQKYFGDELGGQEKPSEKSYTQGAESGMSDEELAVGKAGVGIVGAAGLATMGKAVGVGGPKESQLREEMNEAKRRLRELEANESLRSMAGDSASAVEVEKGFEQAIDAVYGKKSFLGLSKTAGVATKEWGEMARLPANKVLEYYKNPETSDLPAKVLQSLSTSQQHRNLMNGVDSLRQQIVDITKNTTPGGIEIKPFDNGETMESFIKRLGAFRMKLGK